MNIKELVTTFGFNVDTKALEDLQKGVDSVKYGLLGLGASAGASLFTLYELAHSTAETREQMMYMAESTGMSVEAFSKLSAVAKLGGIDVQEFGMSFAMLNRHLYAARQGNFEAQKTFRQFGIGMDQLRATGFKTEGVLQLVAQRVRTMGDENKRSALMTEMFGRAGTKMIPLLKRLQEFQDIGDKMGVGITAQQAEESEAFLLQMREMGLIMKGIKNTVSNALIPAFTDLLKQTNQWLLANRQIIKNNLAGFAKALAKYLRDVFVVTRQVAMAMMDMVKAFGGAESATRLLLSAIGILSGISVLYGIGRITTAVWGLVNAFKMATMWESLGMLGWGALVVGLILVLEDLYSYANGKKSITGILLDKLTPDLAKIVGSFITLKTDIIQTLDDLWDYFASKNPVMKSIDDWMNRVSEATARLVGMHSGSVMDALNTQRVQPTSYATNAAAMAAGIPLPNGGVEVNATITVHHNGGGEPSKVAEAVKRGVADGMHSALSRAKRDTSGGRKY